MLAVIETHPIQYHAPVYRALAGLYGVPVTVIYGSDFSVNGYLDPEFGASFAWDTDLLSGYKSVFLSEVSRNGARDLGEISTRGLRAAMREVAPKAVLLVGYSPRFHRAGLYQASRAGYSVLFRGETTDHAVRRGVTKAWVRDRALRWLYRRCARLLYVGQRSHEHFRRLGVPEEKLLFSPYCVDTRTFQPGEQGRSRYRASVRRSLGIAEHDTVVLFSGKLVSRKGPDLLLRAVRQLNTEIRERIVVLFMGDGDLRAMLERLAQVPTALRVSFLGFQNQTHLSRYYHAADVLVLPSRHSETWGLVVNEALHHGLPCVVSKDVGCAPDLIEPGVTGQLFDAGSDQSLASALQRTLPLVGRGEVRERCRGKVGGYSVERAADGIARAYAAVAGTE